MSHTPGPWTVEWSDEEGNDGVTIEAPDGPVAFRVLEVDSRLIAAAPEMLAALREVADGCARRLRKGKDQGDLDTLRLCRTAIEQAEGVTTEGTNGKKRSLD